MSTFRHVLMIRFSEEATENQIEELYRVLGRLPAVIEEIQRFEFGPDLGLDEGNPDMALIADFESEDDWSAYQNHPGHLLVSQDLVKPISQELIRVQYLVQG